MLKESLGRGLCVDVCACAWMCVDVRGCTDGERKAGAAVHTVRTVFAGVSDRRRRGSSTLCCNSALYEIRLL